jgi:hypothetical protein
MEDKLLLSPDMGRVPSLVFFPVLPYFVRSKSTSRTRKTHRKCCNHQSWQDSSSLLVSPHAPALERRARTQVLLTSLTFPTGADLSSDTYSISDFEFLDSLADLDDFTDDFVSGDYEGSCPWSPASC